jgi:hypothetical protein
MKSAITSKASLAQIRERNDDQVNAAVDSLQALASSMASAKLPGEIVMVDRLCEKWARWARDQFVGIGWARTSITGKMIEWHELWLQPEKLYPAAGKDKAPDGVMLIDRAVARLPLSLRRCVEIEYFNGGPDSVKAKRLGISRTDYRQHLRSAQWAIYVRLDAQLELAE